LRGQEVEVADAGEGHRLAALRRFVVVPLAAAAIATTTGCNVSGDGDGQEAVASTSTTTAVDVDAATADLRQLLDTSSLAIAEDVSALGLTPVTAEQVGIVAGTLCESAFDPHVTTAWLDGLIVTNLAMLGPANRLLRYSGTPEVCPREPTESERDFYEAEVHRALEAAPPLPPGGTQVPGNVQALVCGLLDGEADAGTDAAAGALAGLTELASRGHLEAGELLPYVVEVAGAGCDQLLPIAVEALDRYLAEV
jgi:hypothetical protein